MQTHACQKTGLPAGNPILGHSILGYFCPNLGHFSHILGHFEAGAKKPYLTHVVWVKVLRGYWQCPLLEMVVKWGMRCCPLLGSLIISMGQRKFVHSRYYPRRTLNRFNPDQMRTLPATHSFQCDKDKCYGLFLRDALFLSLILMFLGEVL